MAPISREEVTDEVLMMRFQGGDRAAFGSLVRGTRPPFSILSCVRSASAQVAEDLVQDVFVKIVHNATEFKHEARFTTWAYAIARNICIDHLRKMALEGIHRSISPRRTMAKDLL
jgi:RNA polymerase sigma-70 factor (ECF subfamily)